MTMKRVFTFKEADGLSSHRADHEEVAAEDRCLRGVNLSNEQLAILYFVNSQADVTDWEIEFALVMNEETATRNLQYLRSFAALKSVQRRGSVKLAFQLTDAGKRLLAEGLNAWRDSKASNPDRRPRSETMTEHQTNSQIETDHLG